MKKIWIILVSICIFASTQIYAQNISNIAFINEIADKDQATFADGVQFFLLTMGKNPGSFEDNIKTLDQEGITRGITLTKDSPLRRGAFALMIARHLKLGDSLLYMLLKIERYAYRACAANEIMHYDGSEWDKLSGGELIEIMAKASDFSAGNE